MSTMTKIANPLLDKFKKMSRNQRAADSWEDDGVRRTHAWGMPCEVTLACVTRHSPLIEWGAGTGYWSWLLEQMGVDIVAYDISPPDRDGSLNKNRWHPCANCFARVHCCADHKILSSTNRNLFICWPPKDRQMLLDALLSFGGCLFIHIGEEGNRSITGTPEARCFMEIAWREVERMKMIRWPGCKDYLTVHVRREVPPEYDWPRYVARLRNKWSRARLCSFLRMCAEGRGQAVQAWETRAVWCEHWSYLLELA